MPGKKSLVGGGVNGKRKGNGLTGRCIEKRTSPRTDYPRF